jgi:hypothetical protein
MPLACLARPVSYLFPVVNTVEPTILPMHRVLAIEELVAAIIAHADRPSTLAIACTSRGLCEPALDSLWKKPPVWDLALRMPPELYTTALRDGYITLVRCFVRCSSLRFFS